MGQQRCRVVSATISSAGKFSLRHGRVVEHGRATEVIRRPADDYTKLLLSAIPNPFATDGPAHPSRDEALHRR